MINPLIVLCFFFGDDVTS